ncbi:hypothetical protein LguiB_021450 [Lonicera macranthoides]
MGSLDSTFSSHYSEQKWVRQINKHFAREVRIDVENVPVSVFNVPKSLSGTKMPDAYLPQVIGLGPYHHLRPELYQMERYKIATIRSYLNLEQTVNFHDVLIERLKEIEPTIRACYHKYLDMDDETLAWIIAIDGLFLLHLLLQYSQTDYIESKKLTEGAVMYRDVMVLENQIPVILLKEMRKTLGITSPNADDDEELLSMFVGFCEAHSPLKPANRSQFSGKTNHLHLLDLMYLLIVNRRATKPALYREPTKKEKEDPQPDAARDHEDFIVNVDDIVEAGMDLGSVGRKAVMPIRIVKTLPWDKISNLLGLKLHEEDNNDPEVEEISIPSVTKLIKHGGINFSHTTGGIRDVEFVEEEAMLYLPVITLNGDSEVLLRNLVAYEHAASGSTLELAQYVDLMCGIIDTVEDAKLLREKGIIKGSLDNEEVADLFNGMNKSSASSSNEIVEKINNYYSRKPVVKLRRFVENRIYASWKALTLLSTIFLLLLLLLESFCQVYGCASFLGQSN